jgi:hypothetical protein
MTWDDTQKLISTQGQELLGRLSELWPASVADLTRLCKSFEPVLVANAATLMEIRGRAKDKFRSADLMLFDRPGYEQSTGTEIAEHLARRFEGAKRIADLCCGIGGDALALVGVAPVVAVDTEPVKALMTRYNKKTVLGSDARHGLSAVAADVTRWVPEADAIMWDPARRIDSRRIVNPAKYSPSIALLDRLRELTPEVCAKVAPGVGYESIPSDVETEWVSSHGQCREAAFWCGRFITTRRRATVLPTGDTLTTDDAKESRVGDVGAFLIDPDPAVVRSHLVQRLAAKTSGWRIDGQIAYLCTDDAESTPFGTKFAVEEVIPYGLNKLREYLKKRCVGSAEIRRRRFPVNPDELRSRLKLSGDEHRTLICTRIKGKTVVIVCHRQPS